MCRSTGRRCPGRMEQNAAVVPDGPPIAVASRRVDSQRDTARSER